MAHCTRIVALAALLGATTASAQRHLYDLTSASLEELMDIEVYSVAKKAQRMGATAASVYVISAEDIRRSGIRVVPELLRLAPGVQVARTQSGGWAISVRGFAGEFSNKLLVVVDGRSIYDELYGGIFWELQDMLVDDIDRIEVIRGPGAAMWGINAVNGVINIITKPAAETSGGLVKFAAGSETEVSGAARMGGSIGSNAAYRVSAYYSGHGPYHADSSPLPASRFGWNVRRLDFRLDWAPTSRDTVEIAGSGYVSQLGHSYMLPAADNLFPAPKDRLDGSHTGNVQARWQHKFSDASNIVLRGAWTATDSQLAGTNPHAVIGEFEFQHNLAWGRNQLTWGLNYRDVSRRVPPAPEVLLDPASSSQDTYAGFFSDQFELVRDRLYFIAGLHVSDNQFTGVELQPTGRLLWTPTKRWTGWAAVSRAVRTPTLFERSIRAYIQTIPIPVPPGLALLQLQPNLGFRAEPMLSYEAGQRFDAGRRFSLDVSGFLSFYQRMGVTARGGVRFVPPTATSPARLDQYVSFVNGRRGQARGVEAAATWVAAKGWKLAGGYSWLWTGSAPYAGQENTMGAYRERQHPDHQFQIRSYYDLTRTIEIDAALYYTGRLPDGWTAVDAVTPAYWRGDLRVGWHPNANWQISVGVQNGLDPSHPEMRSSSLNSLIEVPRNVYGSVTWQF